MKHFTESVPAVQPTDDRQFLHTRTAGFDVMLLQSLATGAILFVAMLTLALAFDWMDPFKWAAVAGVAGILGWWLVSLRRWTMLTQREPLRVRMGSVDDDNDPVTPPVIRIQLDRVTEQGHIQQSSIFDLPEGVTEAMMQELAAGILNMKRPFTELEWCGAGKPFSMPRFRILRALLEKHQLIAPRNEKDKRQGLVFTSEGETFLEGFLPE